MTSLLLARVFQYLFTFVSVSALRWLEEIWQLSRRGAKRELEVNSNPRDVVASSPSFSCPAARAPQRACTQTLVSDAFDLNSTKSRETVGVIVVVVLFSEGNAEADGNENKKIYPLDKQNNNFALASRFLYISFFFFFNLDTVL